MHMPRYDGQNHTCVCGVCAVRYMDSRDLSIHAVICSECRHTVLVDLTKRAQGHSLGGGPHEGHH